MKIPSLGSVARPSAGSKLAYFKVARRGVNGPGGFKAGKPRLELQATTSLALVLGQGWRRKLAHRSSINESPDKHPDSSNKTGHASPNSAQQHGAASSSWRAFSAADPSRWAYDPRPIALNCSARIAGLSVQVPDRRASSIMAGARKFSGRIGHFHNCGVSSAATYELATARTWPAGFRSDAGRRLIRRSASTTTLGQAAAR